MRRFVSASVDESAHSPTEKINIRGHRSFRPSHTVSALELREFLPPAQCTRKRKGLQQLRRAASSFPLSDISHNARRKPSISDVDSEKTSLSSRHSSENYGHKLSTSDLIDVASAYPSPPPSASEEDSHSPTSDATAPTTVDQFPFPLNPVPLPALRTPLKSDVEAPRTPSRRHGTADSQPGTPITTPDRYIPTRNTPQEPSQTFHLSKSPDKLTAHERLLRHNSASPDPFGPLLIPRIRDRRTLIPTESALAGPSRPRRPIGTTNITSLPDPIMAHQNRQASAGAVWNIGANALASHPVPIRSVSDGRGGFISGGTNAPMYTSQFFDNDTSDQDLERMEARLAAALEIDQTARILNISRFPASSRSFSARVIGSKRKWPEMERRTHWKHGEWVKDSTQSRECIGTPVIY